MAHIGAQAAAKNCITVGSCDNERETDDESYTCYKSGGRFKGNPNNVSQFSSRGPTKERRIKPDVVAPGSMILSTASQYADTSDCNHGYWPESEWSFMSGTSMATPLVAGCVAVIRSLLQRRRTSAALVKAIIINSARNLNLPHESQGFGQVDMVASLESITQGAFWSKITRGRKKHMENKVYTGSGGLDHLRSVEALPKDSWRHKILPLEDYLNPKEVGAARPVTLKVTLVYTDMPGAVLQINLNLVVCCRINDKLEFWRGNAKSKGLHRRRDEKNNVEQVVWNGLPSNTRTEILVGSYKDDTLRQRKSFAVAWTVTPSTVP